VSYCELQGLGQTKLSEYPSEVPAQQTFTSHSTVRRHIIISECRQHWWHFVFLGSGMIMLLTCCCKCCTYIKKLLWQDLQHPNEFIRGSTLRFLCKLKEHELIEPLMPAIRACLEHRHSYVRRNAVLAIYTIYRHVTFHSLCILCSVLDLCHLWGII